MVLAPGVGKSVRRETSWMRVLQKVGFDVPRF